MKTAPGPGNGLRWPRTEGELIDEQTRLAAARPAQWERAEARLVGGCFVCFDRGQEGPGRAGDRGWAAAAVIAEGKLVSTAVVDGRAGAPYEPGLLALREGALLSEAIGALTEPPDVMLVNATGRDHPRRCGLAFHLGAMAAVPTVGVTHRPLLATGHWPAEEEGAMSPLLIGTEIVGFWVRVQRGIRPLAAHAAWRTSAEDAAQLLLATRSRFRTPDPIRRARQLARQARTEA